MDSALGRSLRGDCSEGEHGREDLRIDQKKVRREGEELTAERRQLYRNSSGWGRSQYIKETEDAIVVYIERKPTRRKRRDQPGPRITESSISYLVLKSMGNLSHYRRKPGETHALY